tara:strand:+ start:501 stop:794 length:294 start_codon:yes stop_codon:yes gene_type:complete
MFDNLDLWDIKVGDNIKKYPKQFHNAVKMRLEQQKYVFGEEKTTLNKFRTLLNKSANDINPELFCNEIEKLFLLIKNNNKNTKAIEKRRFKFNIVSR